MMFTTIAWRELTLRARQETTFLQRLLLAAVAMGLLVTLLMVGEMMRNPRSMGEFMFKFMGWTGMILGGLESVRQTADSLSREKREGTLGLLFLTHVTSLDVVLGKWVVRALTVFYHLLAVFPVLAVPFVLGGVTFGEFARLLLSLVNIMFVGLALGMLVSAWGREEHEVWASGLAWLGLLEAGPLLCNILPVFAGAAWLVPMVAALSPLQPWLLSPHAAYSMSPSSFWNALALSHLLGWLLLVMAGWSMARVWRQMALATPPRKAGYLERLVRPVVRALQWFEQSAWQQKLRFQPPSIHAQFLASYQPPPVLILTVLFSAAIAVAMVVATAATTSWLAFLPVLIFYALHWVVRLWAASHCSEVVRKLRDTGWLHVLLTTPHQRHEIPRALMFSQKPALRMVFTLVMGLEVFALMVAIYLWPNLWTGPLLAIVFLWLGAGIVFWADLHALNAAALYHGLTRPHALSAARRAIFQVLLLPLICAPLGLFCMSLALPLIYVLKSAVIHQYFRERLEQDFAAALERSQDMAPQFLTERWRSMLNLHPKPPQVAEPSPQCVSCGRGVGNAMYCPFCGYRQPGIEV
ncbi:ABC transporter permease subunit [Fontisphaera persica]|uniref:ABC transporter permease n=1 Tax=Fontisphaera persica TaxID=2974023 RepID=UPI0024C0312B|nr:ABC transporter permease subunit [Fontisphaera persica]WCJ58281.1 ABC transporter permease subunit [Fontisphaera persica]